MLIKSNSNTALPLYRQHPIWTRFRANNLPILVYIDGGHSVETITSDFTNLRHLAGPNTVFLLDDYYANRTDGGCKFLETSPLLNGGRIEVLEPCDHITHKELDIHFARYYP